MSVAVRDASFEKTGSLQFCGRKLAKERDREQLFSFLIAT
jgi:hypothetical protein